MKKKTDQKTEFIALVGFVYLTNRDSEFSIGLDKNQTKPTHEKSISTSMQLKQRSILQRIDQSVNQFAIDN